MRKIFLKYAFLFFVGMVMFSCDNEEGITDQPTQREGEKQAILAGTPTIINLLSNDFIGTQATAELVSNPTKGTTKLLANGHILYIPNSDFTAGQDFFDYKITNSATEKVGTMEINMKKDSSDIPCQSGIMTDVVSYNIYSNIYEIEVDVLLNDEFCEGQIDASTLSIAVQGIYGVASVRNGKLIYHPDSLAYLSNDVTDYIVYTVYSDQQEIGSGLLVVNITTACSDCIIDLQDDYYDILNDGNKVVLGISSNDFVTCGQSDSVDFSATFPKHGTIWFEKMKDEPFSISLNYKPAPNYSGQDQFTYTYWRADNTTVEATVFLSVTAGPNCQLGTGHDKIIASFTTEENSILQIPKAIRDSLDIHDCDIAFDITNKVMSNDELCDITDYDIRITYERTQNGQFISASDRLFYVTTNKSYTNGEWANYTISEKGNTSNISNTSYISLDIIQ
jgi:hypothetical protein